MEDCIKQYRHAFIFFNPLTPEMSTRFISWG